MKLLDDMALFVEVVKAKGFRHAAETIGIPNSTLSRRISALEKAVGLRLLHRTTRKIELTEAGQIYYDRCRRIVEEARLAHEQLGDILAQPSGVLRVSLPVDFAMTYLAPLIAEFAALYPNITFELDLSPKRADLISDPVDVAIRMGTSENSQLITRHLVSLTPYLYASAGYLERAGMPETPNDLHQHQCLGILKTDAWTLYNGTQNVTVPINGRFKLNNIAMIRRLATFDLGIILMPEEIVSDDLANGRLRRIMPQWQGMPIAVSAVTETRLLPAKTQHFIEFLRKNLSAKKQ